MAKQRRTGTLPVLPWLLAIGYRLFAAGGVGQCILPVSDSDDQAGDRRDACPTFAIAYWLSAIRDEVALSSGLRTPNPGLTITCV